MEPILPLRLDPEFRPASTERSLPPVIDPAAYRRMLFNPFLGILGVAAWAAGVRWLWIAAVERHAMFIYVLVAWAGAGFLLPRLFQFHCLDCGRSGRISRWRRHVCPAVARRILEGRPLRFRPPGPLAQMLMWGYFLAIVLVLARHWELTSR